MELKQINLTIPQNLLEESQEYSNQYGYKNIQEFILDLIRRKLILDKVGRYQEIEERMKNRIGVKKFNKKEAVKYLKGL